MTTEKIKDVHESVFIPPSLWALLGQRSGDPDGSPSGGPSSGPGGNPSSGPNGGPIGSPGPVLAAVHTEGHQAEEDSNSN